jgi:hypothetical protein
VGSKRNRKKLKKTIDKQTKLCYNKDTKREEQTSKRKEVTTMANTYRIYIKSNEHPRTINTPMMGRTNYTCIQVVGKEAFIVKLNELVLAGEHITEVRYGWGGAYVKYWEYIAK